MKIEFLSLPLNSIKIDPDFVSEALEIKDVVAPNASTIQGYLQIQRDFQVIDQVRVFREGDQYFLVEHYESYKALQAYHCDFPTERVTCLVLYDASRAEVQEHTLRIRELNEGKRSSHASRLLSLKLLLLADPSLTYEDVKEFRGVVGAMQTSKGKMADRDFKLAHSDLYFRGIMGLESLDVRPLKPNPDKALYSYGFCANKLYPVLGSNEDAISRFHEHYLQYIEDVKSRPHPEDFQVKPFFQWTGLYNPEEVVAIAEASVRGTTREYVITPSDENDFDWGILRTDSHQIKMAALTYHQRELSTRNLKRLGEVAYKGWILCCSSKSHIERIRPTAHGASVRTKNPDLDPGYESPMNNLEFESPYFEWVRKNSWLYYCNRQRLLEAIGLRPEHFGFSDYRPYSVTTYRKASEKFNDWYETEFVKKKVYRSFTGRAEDHPKFEVYSCIQKWISFFALKQQGQPPKPIYFKDFINRLFKFVFDQLDATEADLKRRTDSLNDLLGQVPPIDIQTDTEIKSEIEGGFNDGSTND